MGAKDTFQKKIETQLTKWKTKIDELRTKVDQTEASAKVKFAQQLESLHDRREKAEKLLEQLKSASEDAWDNIKSGAEHGWSELSRTAKRTMSKVREAVSRPNRDEEIRIIAYHLWRDEGCPDGRHTEHWLRAEAIWQEQQKKAQLSQASVVKPKSATKKKPARKKPTVRRTRSKPAASKGEGN
jgi:chromosome segregation ATPase